jgi:hypothetical protein
MGLVQRLARARLHRVASGPPLSPWEKGELTPINQPWMFSRPQNVLQDEKVSNEVATSRAEKGSQPADEWVEICGPSRTEWPPK